MLINFDNFDPKSNRPVNSPRSILACKRQVKK
jgi:hypothetical protein